MAVQSQRKDRDNGVLPLSDALAFLIALANTIYELLAWRSVSFGETQMVGRDRDIQRLGDLTGNNVEFRQFSAPVAASSDWSLLNAVSRSAEPSRLADKEPQAYVAPDNGHTKDWSMLASVGAASPVLNAGTSAAPAADILSESKPETQHPQTSHAPRPAADARPGFAHLFRKTPENIASAAAATPLAELLKAISRCP